MQLCPAYTDGFSDLGNPTFLLEAYGVRNIPSLKKKKNNNPPGPESCQESANESSEEIHFSGLVFFLRGSYENIVSS